MMKARVQNLLRSILETFEDLSLDNHHIMLIAERYITSIQNKVQNEGKVTAVKFFKEMYLFGRNISLELPLPAPVPFTRTDKNGIPKVIKPLVPLLTGSVSDKRVGLTILRFYESIYVDPNPDLSAIKLAGTGRTHDDEFNSYIMDKIPSIVRATRSPSQFNYKVINRQVAGPNGPAMLTAHYDALALARQGMLDSLAKLCEISPNWGWFQKWAETQAHFADAMVPSDHQLKTGKLSFLPEAGGKTRTIAIGDYWSQLALRTPHNILMRILRSLETDGTWDQDKQSERILKLTKGKVCYSYDLSSATDRFPIELQRYTISALFGERFSYWWKDIMTNRPFHIGNGVNNTISWGVGQPLGMYSSWATFALTHHLLIEFCAFKEGNNSFREYAVLGDDVVIWNERVASRYKEMMTSYGVSINESKSVVSKGGLSQIEFAKRLFISGKEISGLKYTILDSAASNFKLLPDLFRLMALRGYNPNPGRFIPTHIPFDKIRTYATVLLIEAGWLVPPYGVTLLPSDIEKLKLGTFRLRLSRLETQRDLIWEYLSGNKPLKEQFDKAGICIDSRQIDPAGGNFDLTMLHPVVYELNYRGEQVFELLELLSSLDSTQIDLAPGPLPLEYIPTVNNSAFFGDRKALAAKWHSSLVIEAFKTQSLESLLAQ